MTAPPFRGIYPMLYAFFGGAHGIAVLGLATEVGKLSPAERADALSCTAEALASRLPLAVTHRRSNDRETSRCGARRSRPRGRLANHSAPTRDIKEADLLRFFSAVADHVNLPVATQNAPDLIGVGLGTTAIQTMRRNHGNITLLKGEGPVLTIRRIIKESEGTLAVFNGRAGLELTDNLRAGCAA
jgi:2-keto-3-deoxy-L-arabinonate dehydratase